MYFTLILQFVSVSHLRSFTGHVSPDLFPRLDSILPLHPYVPSMISSESYPSCEAQDFPKSGCPQCPNGGLPYPFLNGITHLKNVDPLSYQIVTVAQQVVGKIPPIPLHVNVNRGLRESKNVQVTTQGVMLVNSPLIALTLWI